MKFLRPFMLLLMSIFYPILLIYPWKIVFAVNAATDKDIKAFAPMWLAMAIRRVGFLPGGIMKTPFGLGLQVGAFYSNEEIKNDICVCEKLLKSVSRFNAKRISLNGVIPSAAISHGIFPENDERFVKGHFGTVFMIEENIKAIMDRYPQIKTKPIGVLGCGYTGKMLIDKLDKNGSYTLYGFDLHKTDVKISNGHFFGQEMEKISDCALIVLLTTRGDDGINSILDFLSEKSIILADTQPKVSNYVWSLIAGRNCIGLECASTISGFKCIPSAPRWNKTTLPGCMVQALVESHTNVGVISQSDFNGTANNLGIRSRLDIPYVFRVENKNLWGDELIPNEIRQIGYL